MPVVARTGDRRLTRRREDRFLAGQNLARSVMEAASRNLELADEDPQFPWRTTIYCDTPDWRVYRSAEVGSRLPCLRFREYHASRPDQAFASPNTWLELKEISPLSRKEGCQVPSRVVPAFLRGDCELPTSLVRLGGQARLLVAARARPVLVTQCYRLAYGAPGDRIRITADHNLSYLAMPWATNHDGAVPCPIGPVIGSQSGVVIEMKWFGELPPWALTVFESLREYALGDRPSKFVLGMRYLFGHRGLSPSLVNMGKPRATMIAV